MCLGRNDVRRDLALEAGPPSAYVVKRRVLLRLASEASNPGDLNHLYRELSLAGFVDPDTRRPPGTPGPRGFNAPSRFFAAPPHFSAEPREMSAAEKMDLRPLLRDRRRALKAADPLAAQRAADTFDASRLPPFGVAALYRAMGSEIDPAPLGRRLAASGVVLALPVVAAPNAPLIFRRAVEGAALVPDALGIAAPGAEVEVVLPDLIVTPLLGFDSYGGRIGQGGGFYDRTLASLRAKAQVFALGLAYDGQIVDRLAREPHDQLLDGVLTPSALRIFRAG